MSSINISIKKEAYDFLDNLRTNNKSFSDVILSFKNKKPDVNNYFGKLKNTDWNKMEEKMKEFRTSFNKRLK